MALIDFTLSNARRFYSSMGNPSGLKGLTVGILLRCSTCKRFGQQAWVVSAIVATEVLICVKFGWETLTIPLPFHVAVFWSISFGVYLVWTVWNFWPSIIGGFGTYREVEDNVDKHE